MPYAYGGASVATWEPPVAEPLPGTLPATIRRLHRNPGTLTFDNGRPLFSGGSETLGAWCDYIRITVGGHDVTSYRGVRTKIVSWQWLDPYGDGPAELSFPQLTELEAWPTWLYPTAKVTLNRVVDGSVVDAADPLWTGMVTRDGLESGPLSVSCEGLYMGRQSRLMHQPYFLHNPARYLIDHLIREHRKIYRADFNIIGSVHGPLIRQRGDRSQTRLSMVDSWLGMSDQEDGDSYTLLPDRSVARNAMRLQLRSMSTPDYTVHAGAHGVKVSLAREVKVNRVYGDGQSKDGGRWGNKVFPRAGYDDDAPAYPFSGSVGVGETGVGVQTLTRRLWTLGYLDGEDAGSDVFDDEVEDAVNEFRRDRGRTQTGTVTSSLWDDLYAAPFNQQSFQGAHYEPLAADAATVQWFRGPGGMVTSPNPDYDRAVVPVEEFVSFGENVAKNEARRVSRARITRAPELVGTVTLTTDPAEASRFDMRAGKTLLVKNLKGSGSTGVKVYISSVEVDWQSASVTLGVSTTALHFVDLQTIRQRQVEARQNPSKRARQALRSSGVTKDTVQGWESEGPSGVLPYRFATAGEWNGYQVVAAEYGQLAEFRVVADDPTEYGVLVFGQRVPESLLNHVVGNPLAWQNILAGRTFGDGVTTTGDSEVTSASASFTDDDIGRSVSGAGIPTGATVSGRSSGTSISVSPPPTATATGVSITLGPNDDNRKTTYEVHADFLRKHLLVQAYGSPLEPGGYFPRRHTNDKGKTTDNPITGVMLDDASQQFATTDGFLWVYIWPQSGSRFHGRAKLIPES